MTVDLEGRVIRGIDMGSQAFRLKWKDLPGNVQNEAFETIKGLIGLNIDQLPAKLHFHQLVNKSVPSARDANKKVSLRGGRWGWVGNCALWNACCKAWADVFQCAAKSLHVDPGGLQADGPVP